MDGTEGYWRELIEHWPGYVLTIDGEDRLTYLSRNTSLIDAERDLGRDLFDFVAPEEQSGLRGALAAVRAGGEVPSRRTRGRLEGGTRRWYESRFVRLRDRSVMVVSNDVTAEEEGRVALERSEQRHRALVEHSHDVISLTSADGTTLYVSPAVERISGYPPSDFVGLAFANLHPDDRQRVADATARIQATPSEPVTFEYQMQHRDGSYRWIEATGTNLIDDPSVGAVVTNFRDITTRRELAEERPRADQGRRSQERLRVLSQATQAFSEASRSFDGLLNTVVHEVAESLQCACALSLITDDRAHFTTAHVHAPDPDFLASFRAHLAAEGPRPVASHPGMKHVVETGTPFFLAHVDADQLKTQGAPEVLHFAREMRIKSVILVPLMMRGRIIGALGLTRHGELAPPLDEQDIVLIQTLAEHATLALSSARLLEESQHELAERERMAARLRVLADASREFSEATGDHGLLLTVIARRLGAVIGDLCAIRAVSEDGLTLESGAVYHRDPGILAWARAVLATYTQRVGEGATGRVAASGEAVFIPRVSTTVDYAAATSPQYREIIERLDVGSVILVPMRDRGHVVGVVTLLRSGFENPYTESDLNLVQNVADHAALAVANARSYAAERTARAVAVEANQAVHDSEVAHRLLFEASPIPLLVFDVETLGLLAVNQAVIRQYGYTRDELLGMRLSDLRPETDRGSVRVMVDTLGEAEAVGMVRHQRKDGSGFFAEYTSRPLLFGGRRARFTVIADVTARHDAEQMRALLAAIVVTSNDAIVSKQLDGTITSWNDAAERLFGYSAAEAVGQPVAIVIPPDRLDEERALLASVATGERVEHYKTVRRRKDGTEVAVSISLAPILDAFGKVVGASKTARDLTAQHQAERALRNTEDQLRQAQKMEAVGRLAAGIAHDFNNLLSVILGYDQLIQADLKPNDPAHEGVEEIHKAALRAADLTRQLLMFSRQQVVAPKVLDLDDVLAKMDKMLTRIVGEDVVLVSAPGSGAARVFADPSNVEQVIMNLVVNARDAMPTGGTLTIETANVDLDENYARQHLGATRGHYVMLAVTDTGVGMDRETQARIFEPFFTTKPVGQGTGLGLSTVFGIAQQAGGSVWVYSEPGRGTTFKVYFPRVEAKSEVMRPTSATYALRGSETILLVEDQEQVRTVARHILERCGYRVLVAHGAGDALILCEKEQGAIDLLLTDVVMPQMSGVELTKRIEARLPGLKVLFMSGYTDDSIVRHGVLTSEVPFLQKPFTAESLARKVREVLTGTANP